MQYSGNQRSNLTTGECPYFYKVPVDKKYSVSLYDSKAVVPNLESAENNMPGAGKLLTAQWLMNVK